MNFQKFTQKSVQAVNNLEKTALEYGNQEIEQEHLLYSLLTQEESLIARLVAKMDIDVTLFKERGGAESKSKGVRRTALCGAVSEPGTGQCGGRGETDGR